MYFERQGDFVLVPDHPIVTSRSQELEYYISNFQRGMTGPLSYYRTTKSRFNEEKGEVTRFTPRD